MIPSSTVILSQFSVQNQGLWNSCLSLYQDTVGSSHCSRSLSGTGASLPGMLCDFRFLAVLLATLSQFFFSPYFLHFWLYILINSRLVSLGQTSSLSSCLVAKVEFLMFSASPLQWMAWSSIPALMQARKLMPESAPSADTQADFMQLIPSQVPSLIYSYFFLFLLPSAEIDHHVPPRLWY